MSGPVAAGTDETALAINPITVSARKIRIRLASSPIGLHASENFLRFRFRDLTAEHAEYAEGKDRFQMADTGKITP